MYRLVVWQSMFYPALLPTPRKGDRFTDILTEVPTTEKSFADNSNAMKKTVDRNDKLKSTVSRIERPDTRISEK